MFQAKVSNSWLSLICDCGFIQQVDEVTDKQGILKEQKTEEADLMRELITKKNTLKLHQLQIKEMVNNNGIRSKLEKKKLQEEIQSLTTHRPVSQHISCVHNGMYV